MNERTLSQFMCDFIPKGATIEIDGNWLQELIREKANNERLMRSQLSKSQSEINRLSFKVEALKANAVLSEMDSNIIYKINVRG